MNKYLNKVTCCDCLAGMRDLPDGCVDMILIDPPYGINMAKRGIIGNAGLAQPKNYIKSDWDKAIPSKEYFNEIFRISKNQIIFGGNYFVEYLPNSPCWIVWDKDNSGNYADAELLYTSFKTAVRIYKWRWNGMLQQDMKNKETRYHPTQKPVGLLKKIIQDYTKEGCIICDSFIGSGTTAVAAIETGRQYIGFELSQEYCDIAEKRIAKAMLQRRLF